MQGNNLVGLAAYAIMKLRLTIEFVFIIACILLVLTICPPNSLYLYKKISQ